MKTEHSVSNEQLNEINLQRSNLISIVNFMNGFRHQSVIIAHGIWLNLTLRKQGLTGWLYVN